MMIYLKSSACRCLWQNQIEIYALKLSARELFIRTPVEITPQPSDTFACEAQVAKVGVRQNFTVT